MKLSSREQLLKEAASELKRIRKEISNDTLSEGKRRYKLGYNIGKSKYVISFHDGESKHKDGSDFFDVKVFQDKKKFDAAIKDLERVGYVAE